MWSDMESQFVVKSKLGSSNELVSCPCRWLLMITKFNHQMTDYYPQLVTNS